MRLVGQQELSTKELLHEANFEIDRFCRTTTAIETDEFIEGEFREVGQ